jgi:DNA invertase Pin-like site-specific DNA recombinase
MVKPTRPVDIYVRVSRVGKREHLMSPEDQESSARAYAAGLKLRVGKVIRDIDESGGRADRPGLLEAVERVESGASGGVVVAYFDRFSRDVLQGLEILRRIEDAGGKLYAPNMPGDTRSGEGEFQVGLWLLIAQRERRLRGEGFERAKENAVAKGVPIHSRPPVGYRKRSKQDRRLEPNPRTAPIVREVFERRAQGEGPSALGRYLEANRVKTSQGSRTWSKQAVYGLLKNPIYKGLLRYGQDDRFTNTEGVERPIVDAATWEAAQHPNGRNLHAAKSGESSWLVAGVLRCHACRYSMQGTTTSRGKRIYRCTRRHAGGVCPDPARIDADIIEAAAVEAFWKLTADIEASGVADTTGELDGLEKTVELAEQRVAQLSGADAQDALGESYLDTFRQRREELAAALDALGQARAAASRDGIPSSDTLRRAWERMTIQDRRELLGLRFHALALSRSRSLVVYPAGSDIELPTRGFKRAPVLVPFPAVPRRARSLTL